MTGTKRCSIEWHPPSFVYGPHFELLESGRADRPLSVCSLFLCTLQYAWNSAKRGWGTCRGQRGRPYANNVQLAGRSLNSGPEPPHLPWDSCPGGCVRSALSDLPPVCSSCLPNALSTFSCSVIVSEGAGMRALPKMCIFCRKGPQNT